MNVPNSLRDRVLNIVIKKGNSFTSSDALQQCRVEGLYLKMSYITIILNDLVRDGALLFDNNKFLVT
ncbi:hypothetical protein D3C71_1424140 [compost metagenome]